MAQWNKNQQDYLNQERTLHEVYIQADQYGNIISEGATGRGAFGEYAVSEITPVVQLDPIYGLPTNSFQTYSFSSGIATTRNSLFVAETGTSAYGYGVVRSKRFLRYRPGQGGVARFTAHFINPTVGVTLRAGFFSQESALQIGFNTNGKFGILRQYGTKAEIRKLTITTAASSSGISTVILNGTSYNVSLVNDSADTSATAAKLGFSTSYTTHIPDQRDSTIIFLANSTGPQTGNFQFIPGTTGAVGTFTTIQTGVVATEDWTYQEDWNLDNLTGVGGTSNPSGVTLDTTKLNVFQINYRWLGAGEQRYAIENPINGDMIFFHHAHYSNRYNIPWVDNPFLNTEINLLDAFTGQGPLFKTPSPEINAPPKKSNDNLQSLKSSDSGGNVTVINNESTASARNVPTQDLGSANYLPSIATSDPDNFHKYTSYRYFNTGWA